MARARLRRRPVLPDAADGPLSRGARADARERPRLPVLHVDRRTRCVARAPARGGREAALRWHVAPRAGQGAARAAGGRDPRAALSQSADGVGRLGRRREGPRRDLERGARRSRHRAPRRHADVQLLRRRRRSRHGHHARDPRGRPCEQYAAPDQHPARARRRSAGVRASADRAQRAGREDEQAPRRDERDGLPRCRLSAGGGAQLSRASRLVARRRGDLLARAVRRMVRSRASRQVARAVRSQQAELAEQPLHQGSGRRAPGRAGKAVLRGARHRRRHDRAGPGPCGRDGADEGSRVDGEGDRGEFDDVLPCARPGCASARAARDRRGAPGARRVCRGAEDGRVDEGGDRGRAEGRARRAQAEDAAACDAGAPARRGHDAYAVDRRGAAAVRPRRRRVAPRGGARIGARGVREAVRLRQRTEATHASNARLPKILREPQIGYLQTSKPSLQSRFSVVQQSTRHGGIAQLGERLHGMQEVSGSIPLTSTS
ncbi:hypothetical protein BURPS1710b_2626 [Burkholderia pseudomallei 1710b]|uniref:Uncharacterized protein n=1 Tax=Burkholderia pseudomallei (strain 1710b) TaxID=320372 RepID=Q3JQZ0_BURP1|nr:hypothetical protein BURPS1710b_2626 [Burkholderia pseudomallei 1710b]